VAAVTHAATPPHGLSLLLLLILGTNWGLGFTLSKFGVMGGLHPLAYAFWQCTGGGVVLLLICAVRRQLPPVTWRHVRYYFLCGVSNIAAPNFIALTALSHGIPVGIIVLLVTLAPLITYGIAQVTGLESFNRRRVAGIAVGLAGAGFILIPSTSLPSPDALGWVVFALMTPLCYGFSNVYVAWARPADVPSLALGGAMQLVAGASLLPLALAFGKMHVPWPLSTAEIANLSHIAVSSIGSMIFFELMRVRGPVFASQVGYIVCLSGVFWGKLFFGEQHSIWVWLAMALIFAGLALVTWPKRRVVVTPVKPA
jgi:drug/metabolite transporter (DMT)-like permease